MINKDNFMYSEQQFTTIFNKLGNNKWIFQMGPYTRINHNVTFVISHNDFLENGVYTNIGNFYCLDCHGKLPQQFSGFLKSIYRSSVSWDDTRQAMIKAGFQEKFLGYPTIETSEGSLLDSLLGWDSDNISLSKQDYEKIFNNNYTYSSQENLDSFIKPGVIIKKILNEWLVNTYDNVNSHNLKWKKLSQTVTNDGRVIRFYQNKSWLIVISVIEKNGQYHIHEYIEIT